MSVDRAIPVGARSYEVASAADRWLGFWIRMPLGAWTLVSVGAVCCQTSLSADFSSKGVLESVVCLSVIAKPR
jgi:hypothetical protein